MSLSVQARAPVRIDFAGGWSDVPDFAEREGGGGAVVNAAISLYTRVECLVGGGKFRLHAEDLDLHAVYSSPLELVYDGKLDLHKAALNMLPVLGGVELITTCDVPPGSGLGASGALDVALLHALALCRGEDYAPLELAEMGFLVEASELKLAGGRQDQLAGALGGFHVFKFDESGLAETRALELTGEAAADLARHVSVVYTGQSHFSSATHDRVWEAYHADRDGVAEAIRTMRDLVPSVVDALERGDWRRVGELIGENWAQQQRLDATISTTRTQTIETAVRDAGAWGIKATGAGAGGCVVVMGPADRREAVEGAAAAAGGRVLSWTFDFAGATARRAEENADNGAG